MKQITAEYLRIVYYTAYIANVSQGIRCWVHNHDALGQHFLLDLTEKMHEIRVLMYLTYETASSY